jgi:phosphoribosyl-dephospho-CoA transferase
MSQQLKKPFEIQGTITNIEDEKNIQRKTKPTLTKKVLTVETLDGQVLFMDIRNKRIEQLVLQNIQVNDLVNISYIFQGSIKDNKRYNNIFITTITKIKW